MSLLQLRKRNSNVYRVAAGCALVLGVLAAQSGFSEELRFSIGKQPLANALNEFALQSDREILFAADIVEEKDAEAIEGWYEPEDALAALLGDSGLGFTVTEGQTFLVGSASENEGRERDGAQAETEEQAPQPPPANEEEEPIELKEQVVTGSRMIGGDPTARVYSFTAEDIARRGVSGLEEFFRKLPWSHASLTSQTSNAHNINTPDGPQSRLFDGNGLGISAINLRGLGWENTLVLKDGRRIAGTGGVEGDFVNLLNVPLAAIERVDIQLDGASAVYGSAAIGGVVNFITKKDYRGLSATYRNEHSSTDADTTRSNITTGYGWGSGNVSGVLSRSTTKAITNRKTGWTTLDFRGLFGPEFDRRIFSSGQPGVACIMQKQDWGPRYAPVFSCGPFYSWITYYQLPADHSGVGATVDDFNTFGAGFLPGRGYVEEPSATPLDELPPQNGIDGHTNSVDLSLEQQITEDLRVFANLSWSVSESYQEYDRRILGAFPVPASNAYNPFGVPVFVDYAAVYEGENGLMPAQHDWSENEIRTVVLGVDWDIGDNHQLSLDLNRSKSWRETRGFRASPNRGTAIRRRKRSMPRCPARIPR